MTDSSFNPETDFFNPALFAPSLIEAIGDASMNLRQIWTLAMAVQETDDEIMDDMQDRHKVVFFVGDQIVDWRVESLDSLCRGNALAPSLEKYPKEYIPFFATIEHQVIVYADIFGDPTDDEMKGVYSNLARRPDGKGHSLLHEHMWQACALALGTRYWSKAQLESVLRRLQHSCRTFHTHTGSKNYINTIRQG